MGTSFSAEKNTNIQETISQTMNEFITTNSVNCETISGADATLRWSDVECKGDLVMGDINISSKSKVKAKCLQSNISRNKIQTYLDTNLKNNLQNETSNIVGFNVALDQNTTISKDIQNIVNRMKDENILNCMTSNLSSVENIQERLKVGGNCIVGDINLTASAFTTADCVQKNTSIRKAINDLNTSIESELKSKKSSTGLIVMIIIVAITALIIFIMIKKMKQ